MQPEQQNTRTVAWSIHADSTPVVTRPYFVVGHAGSQNPEDADNFSWHLHISSKFIACHKVLVLHHPELPYGDGKSEVSCPQNSFQVCKWPQTDWLPRVDGQAEDSPYKTCALIVYMRQIQVFSGGPKSWQRGPLVMALFHHYSHHFLARELLSTLW